MHKSYSNLKKFVAFKFNGITNYMPHINDRGCGDCAGYYYGVGDGLFDGDGWTGGYNGGYSNHLFFPEGDGALRGIELYLEETNA